MTGGRNCLEMEQVEPPISRSSPLFYTGQYQPKRKEHHQGMNHSCLAWRCQAWHKTSWRLSLIYRLLRRYCPPSFAILTYSISFWSNLMACFMRGLVLHMTLFLHHKQTEWQIPRDSLNRCRIHFEKHFLCLCLWCWWMTSLEIQNRQAGFYCAICLPKIIPMMTQGSDSHQS